MLRVASREERKPHVGRRDTIQHDRSHVLAVLPEVDECRASARPAVEIDAVVPEDRADVVQIVHRNVCRVEANVGVVPVEAPAKPGRLPRSSVISKRAGTGAAVQGVGLSGPTLIDQHDVPRPLNLTEDAAYLAGQLGCGLSGASGQKEQRIVTCRRSKGQARQPKAVFDVQ